MAKRPGKILQLIRLVERSKKEAEKKALSILRAKTPPDLSFLFGTFYELIDEIIQEGSARATFFPIYFPLKNGYAISLREVKAKLESLKKAWKSIVSVTIEKKEGCFKVLFAAI